MRRRRKASKVERVSSADLESQGEGTWIEVKKKVSMHHLRPVIQMAAWRDDPRIKDGGEGDQVAMVAALEEMLDSFGAALAPVVFDWNWLSDMEAELAEQPEEREGHIHVVLETPIWAGSDFYRPGETDLVGQVVYLGQFPDDCQALPLVAVSEDGRVLRLRGSLAREYVTGEDYVLVGLPSPDSAEAFVWLGLDEMVWIINVIATRFKAETERREGRRHPKATA